MQEFYHGGLLLLRFCFAVVVGEDANNGKLTFKHRLSCMFEQTLIAAAVVGVLANNNDEAQF